MTAFRTKKRHSLAYLGEDWKDCYIEAVPLSYRETNELAKVERSNAKGAGKFVEDLIVSHFIDGRGVGENGDLVPITKENVIDLPVEAISGLMADMVSGVAANGPFGSQSAAS